MPVEEFSRDQGGTWFRLIAPRRAKVLGTVINKGVIADPLYPDQ